MCFRLFYAGAVEGQMPEILSMIQVNKMTPAPAVLVVVRITYTFFSYTQYPIIRNGHIRNASEI